MPFLKLRPRLRGYHVTRVSDGAKLGVVYDCDERSDTLVAELRRLGYLHKRRFAEVVGFDREGDALIITGNWENFLILTATAKD